MTTNDFTTDNHTSQPAHSTMSSDSSQRTETNALFQMTRLTDGQKQRTTELSEFIGAESIADECWLFVAPHDDDLCIGAGLLIQAAVRAGVDVRVAVVTDGRLGYCRLEEQSTIVETRRAETIESFRLLDVAAEKISYLNFPDGGLTPFIGRKLFRGDDGPEIGRYTGLQNSFTAELRRQRPARVFVPSPTDLHPDHRATHSELMISLFHATGAIWPELGASLLEVPQVYELAVYCDFPEPPNLEIIAGDEIFQTKLKSVEAFQSQVQIAALVESIRQAGPYEYIREVGFPLYSAENYKPLFR